MTATHTPLLLGLDLGSTNAKAAAYTLDGTCVAACAVSYPTSYPQPGWAEQRPADWIAALTGACRQLMAALGPRKADLAGLALAAQGPGLVLVDAQGQPLLETSPNWQDTRCLPQADWLIEQVGLGWASFGMPRNSFPAKLLWALEHQEAVARQARYALGIKEYLLHWLTGEFVSEPSSGPGGAAWWAPVFAACDWPLDRLPGVLAAQAIGGQTLPQRVSELDLPSALPVVMGLNDGAAATLSMGALNSEEAVLTLATSGVLRIILPVPLSADVRLAHDLFCWPYVEQRWIAGGQIKSGASALQWFAVTHAADFSDDTLEQLLGEAATSPPGSNGVTFLPYLLGRGSPHPNTASQGAFLGLSMRTQQADLCRAVLEGVAYAFCEMRDSFVELGQHFSQVRISGGGARSALWRQILAAALGCPLTYFAADATLGAAIMAAVGTGFYPDVTSAVQQMVRSGEVTMPQIDQRVLYAERYQEYQRLRDQLDPRD